MRENEKRKHRVFVYKKCVVLIVLFWKAMLGWEVLWIVLNRDSYISKVFINFGMAVEFFCKKQQSCFAKIYLRILQAILQHCNGQKYNANETRISGQIKFTYATMAFCIVLTSCEKKIVLVIENFIWNSMLKAKNLQTFWDV